VKESTAAQLHHSGVTSCIPFNCGWTDDADRALNAARSIGYRLIVKASFGGGGRGMRVVRGDG